MGEMAKFSSQMDAEVLEELRAYAKDEDRKLGTVLTEAVRSYLQRAHVRPAFHEASLQVMNDHDELLEHLAR